MCCFLWALRLMAHTGAGRTGQATLKGPIWQHLPPLPVVDDSASSGSPLLTDGGDSQGCLERFCKWIRRVSGLDQGDRRSQQREDSKGVELSEVASKVPAETGDSRTSSSSSSNSRGLPSTGLSVQRPPERLASDPVIDVSVLPPTAFDKGQVPEGFAKAPVVAVMLPSWKQEELMRNQELRSFEFHLLKHKDWDFKTPIDFDADTFVEAAITYCRSNNVQGVIALDCFQSLCASIIVQELGLPGPSFHSVFLCCNKHYTRQVLTPDVPITPLPATPGDFPGVLKVSDTQFYVGTTIVPTAESFSDAWADVTAALLARGLAERQAFYYKWACRFGWAAEYGWTKSADVHMVHFEPFIDGVGEYQAEVVVDADGKMFMADTGDIEHDATHNITLFKTPGTITLSHELTQWINGIVQKLIDKGYKSGAMDIEFVKISADKFELVEINSRYSYMGNLEIYLQQASHARVTSHATQAEKEKLHEVRNLVNRTRLCLGAPALTLPSRDEKGLAKIAAMIYTDHLGALDDVFDDEALRAMIEEEKIDSWGPKPVYLNKLTTAKNQRKYNGWSKIGCVLMTLPDEIDTINRELDEVLKRLFYGKETGFLRCQVVDEDGDGPTGLRPSCLSRASVMSLRKVDSAKNA